MDQHSASPFPPAPDGGSAIDGGRSADARSVLLVEDNETDIFVIRKILEQSGLNLRLHVVLNGSDALDFLRAAGPRSNCPALILLDLNLPKFSGIEVLKQLREGPHCCRTPVIIVTSSGSESDRDAARQLGANEYFRKPANLAAYMELAAVVTRVLNNRPES